MDFNFNLCDRRGDKLLFVPIVRIENMEMFKAVSLRSVLLNSYIFKLIDEFKEDIHKAEQNKLEHSCVIGGYLDNYNPHEDDCIIERNTMLLEKEPVKSFFYFYTSMDGSEQKGIIDTTGHILAYSNFDDAIVLNEDFVILRKGNLFGFANGKYHICTEIKYSSLDLEPISNTNPNKVVDLAAIASLKIDSDIFEGILNSQGNVILPFNYDKVKLRYERVSLSKDGRSNTIPLIRLKLNPLKIELKDGLRWFDDDTDSECYDLDPWGAKAEMDYIRNNGGDWIDD